MRKNVEIFMEYPALVLVMHETSANNMLGHHYWGSEKSRPAGWAGRLVGGYR